MGIDINGARLLLYAKKKGVRFGKVATIGRQGLHIDKTKLLSTLIRHKILDNSVDFENFWSRSSGYSEPLFLLLGAEEVVSFDFSDYEGATIAQDMNLIMDDSFKERFDVVFDGGSLEHVFNFPVAISNCMKIVKIDGYFISIVPVNNFSGHGFYQFSPELFFRIFCEANGFEMQQVIVYEDTTHTNFYQVSDPEKVGMRVTLKNKKPAYIFIVAKKINNVEPFTKYPQQSDYVKLWEKTDSSHSENSLNLNNIMRLLIKKFSKDIDGTIVDLRVNPYIKKFSID